MQRMLVGVFACVCLVFQQCFVPLHLALNDHVVFDGLGGHAHSHAEHAHSHSPSHAEHADAQEQLASRSDDSHGDHEPHPIDDHLTQLAEAAVLRAPVYVALALAPMPSALFFHELPLRGLLHDREHGPRPPPPRTAAAPRAPPIVV